MTKQINISFTDDIFKKLAKKAAAEGVKIGKPIAITTFCKKKLEEIAES